MSASPTVLPLAPRADLRRALRRTRELMGDDPRLLPLVLRATPMGMEKAIGERTELVVEGFPRSGNTFATFGIQHAQPRPVAIASHAHVPAQVAVAVALRLPTVVVVRDPLDTLTSLLVAAPHVRPAAAWREWVHHHEQVLRLAEHRDGFVVATFAQVTRALGDVTERVNERFGTRFAPFSGTPEATEAVFATIDAHHDRVHGGTVHVLPRPVASRRAAADAARARLAEPTHRARQAAAKALWLRARHLAGDPPASSVRLR